MWLPVLVARFAGGLVGGVLSFALLRHATSAGALIPAAVSALVTGVVVVALLPGMTGRTITAGTALAASFAGAALPVAGTLLVTGQFTTSARGTLVLSGSGALVGVATTILGIALTAWIVSSASLQPGGWRAAPVADEPDWSVPAPVEPPVVAPDHAQPASGAEPERGYWAALEDRATGTES